MNNHKDLDVWNKSIDLVEDIYKTVKNFPKEEIYALSSQLKRSIISIPSNIAEGAARSHNKEFIQFLYIALGSSSELESQVIIANRLGFIENIDVILNNIVSIKKMLLGLISFLKKKK